MQKKQRCCFKTTLLTTFFSCLMLASAQAAKPLWTFAPQTPTEITVTQGETAQVVYTVQNNASKPKTLVIKPISGVSQSAPCELAAQGHCTLTLNINGSALKGDVLGGPLLCQQGNNLQCYQPSSVNILRIRLSEQPPVQQFTVTPSAGANGAISPDTAQLINAGSSLTFTATPDAGFGVNQWLLDGNLVQTGGTSYQLNNIQANHAVQVTFNQTTLSPLTQNLALSINAPLADPALPGNARIVRIENTGSIPANNLQVSTSALPQDTSITDNACTGTLNAGQTCDIEITPGGNANLDAGDNACTTTPGTEPVPATVTVIADNAPSTQVNVLVLGYGCIYQGGFLFSVDDTTPNTTSIGGKVAALENEPTTLAWATVDNNTAADSITDGATNTNELSTPVGQYPAAQACLNKDEQGFSDWFLPAICELGRFNGAGMDAGCGTSNPNLYSMLYDNGLGDFIDSDYWSSTEVDQNLVWVQFLNPDGDQIDVLKSTPIRVRCIRAFTP